MPSATTSWPARARAPEPIVSVAWLGIGLLIVRTMAMSSSGARDVHPRPVIVVPSGRRIVTVVLLADDVHVGQQRVGRDEEAAAEAAGRLDAHDRRHRAADHVLERGRRTGGRRRDRLSRLRVRRRRLPPSLARAPSVPPPAAHRRRGRARGERMRLQPRLTASPASAAAAAVATLRGVAASRRRAASVRGEPEAARETCDEREAEFGRRHQRQCDRVAAPAARAPVRPSAAGRRPILPQRHSSAGGRTRLPQAGQTRLSPAG